jgi:hypothetical protein
MNYHSSSSQPQILETDFLHLPAYQPTAFLPSDNPKTSSKMKVTALLAFALAGIALASPVAEPELAKRELLRERTRHPVFPKCDRMDQS